MACLGWHRGFLALAQASWAISASLRFYVPGNLLYLDDHELGWLQGRKAHHDVDDAQVDVVLGGSFLIALDEVSFAGRCALESALTEEIVHEFTVISASSGCYTTPLLLRFSCSRPPSLNHLDPRRNLAVASSRHKRG